VNNGKDIYFELIAYIWPIYCLDQCQHSQTYIMFYEPQFRLPIIACILFLTALVLLCQEHNISQDVHLLIPHGFEPHWLHVGLLGLMRRCCICSSETVLLFI